MTATAPPATAPHAGPAGRSGPPRWSAVLGPVASGAAVLLAGSATGAVVGGTAWILHAVVAVVVVVAVGAVLLPLRAWLAAPAQLAVLLVMVTAWFTGSGVGGVLPGPSAVRELVALLSGAGQQIDAGLPPVAPTPEILLLVTLGFGTLAIAVFGLAVTVGAPAAGGVPLLVVFAVPTALQSDLLPWWSLVAAAAGYGLLLLLRPDRVRQAPGGVAVVALAVAGALLVGSLATAVGTAGRFDAGSGPAAGADGSIGLNPFTSLRGQLTRDQPRDLFQVSDLRRPTYLRALTLQTYVPQEGWKAGRPRPGVPLAGPLPPSTAGPSAAQTVTVRNLGFEDYWLPVFGDPASITGPPETEWSYDAAGGIAYSERPREEDGWTQAMRVPDPSAEQLRRASGPVTVDGAYLDTSGVDPRVAAIARQVTAGAPTAFDRAMALQEHFTGPGSGFTYSLSTAPGGGGDALVDFLTRGRTGYCEQYASAMAVMLRATGVPARVAVGFTAGDAGADGSRLITTDDAHAWVEAWFPGYGWQMFDPTPLTDGRTIEPGYVQQAREAEGGEPARPEPPAPGAVPPPPAGDAGATPEPPPPAPGTEPSTPAPVPAAGWSPLLVTLAAVVLVVLLLALVPGLWRRHQYAHRAGLARAGGSAAATAAWDEVLAVSRDHGVPVPPGDTVRAAAARIADGHDLRGRPAEALRDLAGRVEASWYGSLHPSAGTVDGLVDEVRTAIAAGGSSLRARVLPPSVVPEAVAGGRRGEPAGSTGPQPGDDSRG